MPICCFSHTNIEDKMECIGFRLQDYQDCNGQVGWDHEELDDINMILESMGLGARCHQGTVRWRQEWEYGDRLAGRGAMRTLDSNVPKSLLDIMHR